jgi:hypothetical protein
MISSFTVLAVELLGPSGIGGDEGGGFCVGWYSLFCALLLEFFFVLNVLNDVVY